VAAGLDLVLISDNELLIQFGLRSRPSELLRDHDVSGLLGRVIGRVLRGPATVRELLDANASRNEDDVRSLLSDLVDRGILADLRTSPVEQYLRYTFDGEPCFPNANVGVMGTGKLGTRIAQCLTDHGIARVTPLDLEEIEQSVMASDFVILALDQPDLGTCHMVNRYAIRERKPWLHSTIDGNFGMIGPLFVPDETACYNDFRALAFAATPNRVMARKHREYVAARGTHIPFAGPPAHTEITAGHSSLAAVHFLLRGTCFAVGRVMIVDFDRMQIDTEDVLKLPRCPVCGTQKSDYRPSFPPAT
jgi:bacteriocin biosynthesis cyclodehydratase domain-containing protein